MLTCLHLFLSHSGLIYQLAFLGEMVVHCFTHIFHGFNSFLRILWGIQYKLVYSLEVCALLCNFEGINRDIFGIIHAINWIKSSLYWSNTCGGIHIIIQVNVFSFSLLLVGFVVVYYYLGVVLPSFK